MKNRILMILCLALTLAAFGCEKNAPADGDQAEAEEPAAQEESGDDQAAEEKAAAAEEQTDELAKVEVAEEGTAFDPAVQPEQLPDGVWYCDMGTAHWAGTQKPEDGKCPECGMKLKQHDSEELAAQKEKAVEADEHAHGEEGHAHEDGEHGHGEGDHGHDDDHGDHDDGHGGHDHH